MKRLIPELENKILENINIQQCIKYIPFGDGEQNYTYIYNKYDPYNNVCKIWYLFFKNKQKKIN